jgi:diacylglycerol kinase (ATP)
MGGIGIVNNPLARRNRLVPATARRLRALVDGEGEVADAVTRDELDRAIDRFKASAVDLVGINGGDGTGHYVFSALAEAYGDDPLPTVALLRGGAMNTVADANKLRGTPEHLLKALLERRRAGAPLRTIERDLLAVGERTTHGFLFGTGTIVVFLDAYYRTERPSAFSAAALLGRGVLSALFGGRFAQELTAREALRVSSDGEEWPDEPFLTVAAGAVPEIGFGFAPFFRCDEQPGFFHAVGVTGSTLQLATNLPRIWFGRPWKRTLAVDAVTRDLLLDGAVRFAVDGELYEAHREVRVSTGPVVRLAVP